MTSLTVLHQFGKRLIGAYRKRFLLYEALIGLLVSIFALYISVMIFGKGEVTNSIVAYKRFLFPLIAQITGTLLGFVITAVSIIISLIDKDIFRDFRGSDSYSELYKVYFSSIKWLGVTTLAAIIGIFTPGSIDIYFFSVILFLALVSTLRLWRTVWVLTNIVEIVRIRSKNKE